MRILFTLLLLSSTSLGQDSLLIQPNCEDLNGIELEYEFLKPNNTYSGVGFICKAGKVLALIKFKEGRHDGVQQYWYENGQLAKDLNYKNGEYDGLCRGWHENGQLSFEESYRDGNREGLLRNWHANGQLSIEGNFKDGKNEGLIRQWWENGQLKMEENFINGVHNGLCQSWHQNGQLSYKTNFKDGKTTDDKIIYYNEEGYGIKTEFYKEGKRIQYGRGNGEEW